MNIGRQAGWYITDIVYLLDVLVVIVYMSFCNCWDYLLLHEDWGECSEDWAEKKKKNIGRQAGWYISVNIGRQLDDTLLILCIY